MQGKRHEEPESPRIACRGQPENCAGGHASELRGQADVEGAATARHWPQVAGRLVIAERHAAQRQIIALVEQVLNVQAQPIDRKSTRLNSSTNAHLVCRLLLEQKKIKNFKPKTLSPLLIAQFTTSI